MRGSTTLSRYLRDPSEANATCLTMADLANLLAKFQADGHGKPASITATSTAQIYAGLDGKNWRLADYAERGGYAGAEARFSPRTVPRWQ